ncbi:MAG: hypothetical protein ABUS56_13815, partial [Acidobacteriota bacterium]
DAAGQLVGVAFSDSAGANRVVFAPQLRLSPSVTSTPDPSSSGVSPRMPVDEVYERGLKTAVQVIVVR